MKSAWLWTLLGISLKWGVVLGIGSFLFTFILFWKNAQPPRYPSLYPESPSLPLEEITFQTEDGLRLRGSFSLRDPKRPTILLCHGVGANRTDLYLFAQLLYEKGGFNVLSFDFRGHGQSEGRLTSYGALEQRDLEAALAFLDRRLLRREYGLLGVSMGASVGILVASRDLRLKALWVDSPYSDLAKAIEAHLKLLYGFPKFPFVPFSLLSYRLLFHTAAENVSPIGKIGGMVPRPLMIVNGVKDERMRPEFAKKLYEKAKEPKSLWLIPGAGHLEGHLIDPKGYDERLLAFFEKAFR